MKRPHDSKYRESLARLKKYIENSNDLSEKPLWGTIFKKNILNFQESIVFEKMRKNESSGFYLINYAKNRVKMAYFIALYRGKIPKYKTEIFLFIFCIFSFYQWYALNHKHDLNFLRFFKNYHQAHFLKWVKNEQLTLVCLISSQSVY